MGNIAHFSLYAASMSGTEVICGALCIRVIGAIEDKLVPYHSAELKLPHFKEVKIKVGDISHCHVVPRVVYMALSEAITVITHRTLLVTSANNHCNIK